MPHPCDVLILEDDTALCRDLVDFLTLNGIEATGVQTAKDFYGVFSLSAPKVLVIDLVLPDDSGIEIIKTLRRNGFTGKVVILSALDSDEQTIEGYQIGADVYLTKGTGLKVITACVRRLLHPDEIVSKSNTSPRWKLHLLRRELTVDDRPPVKLTGKEQDALKILMSQAGETFSRSAIAGAEGGLTLIGERRVDAVISRLRRKILAETGQQLPVDQVYGVGYVFSDNAFVE